MSLSAAQKQEIKNLALKFFDVVGFTLAQTPITINSYKSWIEDGYHGQMEYLKRHIPKKENPGLLLENAKSWISLAWHYDTSEPLSTETKFSPDEGWIARYARNSDYHLDLGEKLTNLCYALKALFPKNQFEGFVDSSPVLERELAWQSGIGWVGKNTCVINKGRGSFILLSEILTDLEIHPDPPGIDHCGNCTLCIESCPTQAIIQPYKVDSNKCISYWTIESKTEAPPELAAKFGNHLFGCDICQDVCPWNKSARKKNDLPTPNSIGRLDLRDFIKKSDAEIKAENSKSAMSRAKPEKLKARARQILKI